jgi:hypothetical protein
VATRIVAARNQEKAPIRHALKFAFHDAGFGWIALVVCRIDCSQGAWMRSRLTGL